MKIKAHWLTHLHKIRRRELEILFEHLQKGIVFENALDLGAGNGFQSEILARRVKHLISTDINPQRLRKESSGNIEYRICDAELIDTYFEEKSFDFIFSSNLLEHLPDPERALQGIYRILKDDGITVHVVPSPFYKLAQMFLFYPNLMVTRVETLLSAESGYKHIREKLKIYLGGSQTLEPSKVATYFDNNPKLLSKGRRPPIIKLLWPLPHGVSKNHIAELIAWQRSRWLRLFESSGFLIKQIIDGPAFSGYGFGFNCCRHFLEKIGLTSETIFILNKIESEDY